MLRVLPCIILEPWCKECTFLISHRVVEDYLEYSCLLAYGFCKIHHYIPPGSQKTPESIRRVNKAVEILIGSTIIKYYCHYLRYTWLTPPGTLNTFSTQLLHHGACVMHTSECIHHTNTRVHEDTLHILHNIYSTYTSWRMCHARVTHTLHILIEHMWHIPTDVYTTHKSPFMWIHYIYTMVYTQHMPHGGRVMHTWSCICRAILRS